MNKCSTRVLEMFGTVVSGEPICERSGSRVLPKRRCLRPRTICSRIAQHVSRMIHELSKLLKSTAFSYLHEFVELEYLELFKF